MGRKHVRLPRAADAPCTRCDACPSFTSLARTTASCVAFFSTYFCGHTSTWMVSSTNMQLRTAEVRPQHTARLCFCIFGISSPACSFSPTSRTCGASIAVADPHSGMSVVVLANARSCVHDPKRSLGEVRALPPFLVAHSRRKRPCASGSARNWPVTLRIERLGAPR